MECNQGRGCPYLDDGDISALLKEREYLRQRLSEIEVVMGLAEAKIKELTEENRRLKEENSNLLHRIKKVASKIFKPNISRDENEKGSKRGAPKGYPGKERLRPKEIHEEVDIYPRRCPCGSSDIEGYERSFDEHVVEDIEVRKKVSLFRMHYGRCRSCGRVVSPQRDGSIIPNSRIGPLARAVGGHLRYLGIPYRKVARIFRDIFQLEISHASLLHFDTKQAESGLVLYEGIKEVIRASSHLHVDETGWRVNGENWWLWVFVNDEAVLYVIDKSRGREIPNRVLGDRYGWIVESDFYSVYDSIVALGKQKCQGHLLKDIKEIEEKNGFSLESEDGRFLNELKSTLKEAISCWNGYKKGTKGIEELKEDKNRIISKMVELL